MKELVFQQKAVQVHLTLKTTKDNELVETKVDMVDTFNYLIGLINLLLGKSYLTGWAKDIVLPSVTAVVSMPRRWNSPMSAWSW